MKNFYLIVLLLTTTFSLCQTKEKAIIIIEDISNYQKDFLKKITYYNNIDFNKELNKVTVIDSINFGNGEFMKKVTRLYLDDLNMNNMKYDYAEVSPGQFLIAIDLKMKSKSVETTTSEITNEFKYLTSKTTYSDEINCFTANDRLLPIYLINKYVQAVSELIGIKQYQKEELFKR